MVAGEKEREIAMASPHTFIVARKLLDIPNMAPLFSHFYPIIALLFLVIIFYLCLKRQSQYSAVLLQQPSPVLNNTTTYNHLPSQGLDASLVESFRLVAFSLQQRQNVERESCPICLDEYRNEEILFLLPCCAHLFHPQCIRTWLSTHATCPLCIRIPSHPLPRLSGSASLQPMTELIPSAEPLNLQVELRGLRESKKLRRWYSMDNPQLLFIKNGDNHDSSSPLSISNAIGETSDTPSSSQAKGKINPHMKDIMGDSPSAKYLNRSNSDKLLMMMTMRKDGDGDGDGAGSSSEATEPFSLSLSSYSMKKRNTTRFAIHNK